MRKRSGHHSGRAAVGLVVTVVLAFGAAGHPASAASFRAAAADAPAAVGRFSSPFEEPTILGKRTNKKCISVKDKNGTHFECKPAAGSMSILANGKVLYWNALEGTENVKNGIAVELAKVFVNDQARLLDIGGKHPQWSIPTPKDAGARDKPDPLVPGTNSTERYNDGAPFCSDLNFLADGRIIATGGSLYMNDPGPDASPYGIAELQGLRNARIYDPKKNTWTQTGSMHYGRWYPTRSRSATERSS